jgi:hypothetical protein
MTQSWKRNIANLEPATRFFIYIHIKKNPQILYQILDGKSVHSAGESNYFFYL